MTCRSTIETMVSRAIEKPAHLARHQFAKWSRTSVRRGPNLLYDDTTRQHLYSEHQPVPVLVSGFGKLTMSATRGQGRRDKGAGCNNISVLGERHGRVTNTPDA